MACVANGDGELHVITPKGEFDFPTQAKEVFDGNPFQSEVADDLVQLCHHAAAGDLVVCGWNGVDPSLSFVKQHGAHAGCGSEETHAFARLPTDTPVHVRAVNYI